MRDITKEVYVKMKVGSVAWVRPVAAKGDTLDSFQAAHDSAKLLEEEGLIDIEKVQRQADGLIDAIAPGQQRFAQLMEQLAMLAPVSGVVAAAAASEYEAANGTVPV